VVLVSSINGTRGKPGQSNYAASKAALEALGKTAARELGRQGVRVNAVAPGWIDTGMTRALPPEFRARASTRRRRGAWASPTTWRRPSCSRERPRTARDGQVLRVDGGQLIA